MSGRLTVRIHPDCQKQYRFEKEIPSPNFITLQPPCELQTGQQKKIAVLRHSNLKTTLQYVLNEAF